MRSFAERKETSENLKAPIVCAEENCDLLVHTGDLIDFVSEASIEFAREILKKESFTLRVTTSTMPGGVTRPPNHLWSMRTGKKRIKAGLRATYISMLKTPCQTEPSGV